MGLLKFLPQTLEWNLVLAAVLVFPDDRVYALPALLMLALGPLWALYYAWQAPLEKCHESLGSRLMVAFLAYTGPMFRTITRYRKRGCRTVPPASTPMPRQRPSLRLRARAQSHLLERDGISRESLLDRLDQAVHARRDARSADPGWNDYDLEIQPDSWTRLRIKTAEEEHEGSAAEKPCRRARPAEPAYAYGPRDRRGARRRCARG